LLAAARISSSERRPEIKIDHRMRPVRGGQPCGVAGQLRCAILAQKRTRKIAPEHRVGVVFWIVGKQESGNSFLEITTVKEHETAGAEGTFRIDQSGFVAIRVHWH
jgi:hypothetical protein